MSYPEHQYRDKEGNIICNWMQDDYECKAPESREGGMCLYATDEINQCPINKLEAVKNKLIELKKDWRGDRIEVIVLNPLLGILESSEFTTNSEEGDQ